MGIRSDASLTLDQAGCVNRVTSVKRQVYSLGNRRGRASRMLDFHSRRVLNGKEADPAGLHEPLDGGFAERAHPEDSVGPPVRERFIRVLVIGADKRGDPRCRPKLFRHPDERLKLPATLCQGDPRASQIRETSKRRVLQYPQLERVLVQRRENPRRWSGHNISLGGGWLRTPIFQHPQVVYRPARPQKCDSNLRVMNFSLAPCD